MSIHMQRPSGGCEVCGGTVRTRKAGLGVYEVHPRRAMR